MTLFLKLPCHFSINPITISTFTPKSKSMKQSPKAMMPNGLTYVGYCVSNSTITVLTLIREVSDSESIVVVCDSLFNKKKISSISTHIRI